MPRWHNTGKAVFAPVVRLRKFLLLVFFALHVLGQILSLRDPVYAHPRGKATVLYPDVATQAPPIRARAALLMDAETGAVLYSRSATARRHPASTTKIMTALLALEFGGLDDVVVISREAAGTPGSSASLKPGEKYRLEDLLYGLMLPSGNDAAVAVAQHISGSVERFVSLMNERARRLGMDDTHFTNPHGLTQPQHFSSAYDLALLTRHAVQHAKFLEIACSRWYQTCPVDSHRRLQWHNTNRLLWSFPYTEGGKTGTTTAAGPCLITVARKGRQRLISVVLDSPDRWGDTRTLLSWGFDTFELLQVARAGDLLSTVRIIGGTSSSLPITLTRDLFAVIPRGRQHDVRLRIQVPPVMRAPVDVYQPVGEITVELDEAIIAAAPVRAVREVGSLTPLRRLAGWVLSLLRFWVLVSGGSPAV